MPLEITNDCMFAGSSSGAVRSSNESDPCSLHDNGFGGATGHGTDRTAEVDDWRCSPVRHSHPFRPFAIDSLEWRRIEPAGISWVCWIPSSVPQGSYRSIG